VAFPAGLPLVTVTCQFDMLPDGGADGFARFVFAGPLTGPGDDSIVHHVDERRTLDEDGTCTVVLPAADAPGWVPQGFEYTVYAGVGEVVHQGRFTLTVDDLTVNLADVVVWSTATADPGVVYATLAQLTAGLATKSDTGHTHAAGDHTHEQADVDDLTTDLAALDTAVAGKAATVHTHVQGDVTGLTAALSGKAATGHTHVTGDVTGLDGTLSGLTGDVAALDTAVAGKADTVHTHVQGDVTGLTGALDGKAATGHGHDIDDVTALQTALDGKLDETGGTVTGDLYVNGGVLRIIGDPGTFRQVQFASGPDEQDIRWSINVDNGAEAGGNAGSRLQIVRYSDTGVALDAVAAFNRDDGSTEVSALTVGDQSIDGAGGVARLGAKNTLTNVQIAGYKATPGAPTTGTWATGDTVMATDGIWRCMTGGTPGVWRCMAGPEVDRIVDDGEVSLDRTLPTGQIPLTTGQLLVTHWTAQVTETILTFRTSMGDTPSLATGTEHAWVGVMRYNGTVYTPEVQCVDNPDLWEVAFGDYETPLFDVATLSVPGFNKVAGVRYASWVLWVGSGDAPELAGKAVWAEEPYREPRLNGYYTTDTPPSVNLNAEWFAPDWRLLQHHLKR
jgi:hypothetical protein